MNDLAIIDEAPRLEKITTMTHQRRENRKAIAARLRKGLCAKRAFSRKQALTARAEHLSRGDATYLNTYKCRCGFWHLSHKRPYRRV